MSSVSRTLLLSLYRSYLLIAALNLIGTVHPVATAGELHSTVTESATEDQTPISGITSTETFSFEDIYRIELNTDIPADIEMIAAEAEAISVKLGKWTQATDSTPDTLIYNYLDNISLTGTQSSGILQLAVQLPEEDVLQATLNLPFNSEEMRESLYLKWTIKTPEDISVKIQAKTGNIRLKCIRGKIEVRTAVGNIELDETVGSYNINVKKGDIDGKILLTHGQNNLETEDGSIELAILDTVAAPMDMTAHGGRIRLELPENYSADIEPESKKQQTVINMPTYIEEDTLLIVINAGGPLFRLKATDAISILPNSENRENPRLDTASDPTVDSVQPVPKAVQPPTIDGNLSEITWQQAGRLSPFQNPDGTSDPENPTDTFLIWDTEHLYIGVRAYLPEAQLPHISQTQQDSPIWEDECIEILIDPNVATDSYYHFVINPIGALFDQQVDVPGEPNFRFAPYDVQRTLNQKIMQTKFDADRRWTADAAVATQINSTFWSIEIAIPRKILEKPSKFWLFNIHRKAYHSSINTANSQREYSYWLPTYDNEHPWWPHSPHRYTGALSERSAPAMGILNFVTASPTPSEAFTPEAQFRVTTIQIEGNITLPAGAIQQSLPIQSGDVIAESQLPWLIAELRHHEWFEDIQLETRQIPHEDDDPESPPTVSVHLRVTEVPIEFAGQVKINGNKSLPARFVTEWFQLKPGYVAEAAARFKAQLLENFYLNRGYDLATVHYQWANNVLTFSINEGTLNEIRFIGNARIPRAELLAALNLKTQSPGTQTAEVYRRSIGQSKINRMRKALTENSEHFKAIRDWRVQREGGKNVMIVEIEERHFSNASGFPILQFNRVHGLMLGAGGTLTTHFTGNERIFASISRGFSSRIWNYQTGIEKGVFKHQPLKFGASLYKLTDISSNISLGTTEISLSAAYYGFALQDYYERKGIQSWITYAPSDQNQLTLEFTAEEHNNLSKSTNWSYLDRNRIKRENPRIDTGQLSNLSLVYMFDTRDHKSTITRHFHTLFYANERTRRGWRGQIGIQMAGRFLGGEHQFNVYRLEIARYTPLYRPHHLNVRIAGDFSNATLPRQRILHLGSAVTLRGYDFNTFAGDNRLLLNLEYRFIQEKTNSNPDALLGWSLSCFLDTGSTWWHGDHRFADLEEFIEQFKTSIGLGGSVFVDPAGPLKPWSLGIEVATPITSWDTKLILRLERIF